MAKAALAWNRKKCGCVKSRLPINGRVTIRCERHRGKPVKKGLLCYFNEDGHVRRA